MRETWVFIIAAMLLGLSIENIIIVARQNHAQALLNLEQATLTHRIAQGLAATQAALPRCRP